MKATPGSFTASAKSWLGTVTPPTVTASCDTKPESEPLPYWIAKSVPFLTYDVDFVESYFEWILHAMFDSGHVFDGTHRFEEPVSKTTLNDCAGVPMEIGP